MCLFFRVCVCCAGRCKKRVLLISLGKGQMNKINVFTASLLLRVQQIPHTHTLTVLPHTLTIFNRHTVSFHHTLPQPLPLTLSLSHMREHTHKQIVMAAVPWPDGSPLLGSGILRAMTAARCHLSGPSCRLTLQRAANFPTQPIRTWPGTAPKPGGLRSKIYCSLRLCSCSSPETKADYVE